MPDFFGVILCPCLATSQYFFKLTFVVAAFGSVYALLVVRCPELLVLGDLFLVLFLVLPARLDPMRQIRSGFLVLGVLLYVFKPVSLYARPDTNLALVEVAVCHLRIVVEICKVFFDSTAPADLRAQLTRYLGL